MAENNFSLPILLSGKFSGRALAHINEIVTTKVSAAQKALESELDSKLPQASFDSFMQNVSGQLGSSETQVALAEVKAELATEKEARQSLETRLDASIDSKIESALSAAANTPGDGSPVNIRVNNDGTATIG